MEASVRSDQSIEVWRGCSIQTYEVGCSMPGGFIVRGSITSSGRWTMLWPDGHAGNTRSSEAIEPVGSNGSDACRKGHLRSGLTGESESRERVHEWELDELRSSSPLLGARGGETPARLTCRSIGTVRFWRGRSLISTPNTQAGMCFQMRA
jgi:hypothetical protein